MGAILLPAKKKTCGVSMPKAKTFQDMQFHEQEEYILKRFGRELDSLNYWNKQFIEWGVWPKVVLWTAMYTSGWDYDSPMPPHLVKIIKDAVKRGMETHI
jgi:hypothetical protein